MPVTISRTIDAKPFTIPFRELIKKYPSLNAFLVSSNPPKFDLGDTSVLSLVNKHLFHALLGLEIVVPPNNLIPTIGLRHAYCSSVLSTNHSNNSLLEIGVGSSAAISLILAKKYNKSVLGTEIAPTSYESALTNVRNNNLLEKIHLVKSSGEIIQGCVPSGRYSALFCYPPIYSQRDITVLEKKRGWKGTKSELIGGKTSGMEFSLQLIDESLHSAEVFIEKITLLLYSIEQVELILTNFPEIISYEVVKIKAGTRSRYSFIVDNPSL